ncbi:MAG TPA: hypothetical protein VMK42_11950 [Anaeromyxobacteraceae bacterium]|nr:hypothetical protein [Anaeromyxobacteraceae bacterium]
MKHLMVATALAIAFVSAALATGTYRNGALVGAATSSATALISLILMRQGARRNLGRARKVRAALGVVGVTFVARILVVAAATFAVVHAGSNLMAFVLAFFVSYCAFASIEGAYVYSLTRTEIFG